MNTRIILLLMFVFISVPFLVAQEAEEDENGNIANFRVKGTRLDDLLRMLGRRANINLVLTEPMEQEVTMELKDAFSPMKLIEILVDSYNYELEKTGSIMRVVRKKKVVEDLSKKIINQVFILTVIPVEEVQDKLKEMLTSEGEMSVNSRANAVHITDVAGNMEKIKRYVEFLNTQNDNTAVRTHQKVIQLHRVNPQNLFEQLRNMKSEGGKLAIDGNSRTVMIQDDRVITQQIEDFLRKIDAPELQVYIQCKFIEITLDARTQMGTKFSYIDNIGGSTLANGEFDTLPEGISNGGQDSSLFTFATDEAQFDFSALANRGNARLLSNPNLLCNNKETSTINIVTKVPFIQAQVRNSDNQDVTEQVEFEEVGVRLTVTPEIFRDGYVRLRMTPEVSEVIDFVLDVPVTKRKTLSSTVTVKSGQRIIMGGLMEDQIRKTRFKVPILGDIPILGLLFSREDQSIVKTELIILVDVSIVNADILEQMSKSAVDRQRKRYQENYDLEFEFYPHLKEGLDIYDVKPLEKDAFGYTFQPHKDKKVK